MIILQGECIGGGSVVNNAVCFRMPAGVQREWEEEYGLDLRELSAEYGRDQANIRYAFGTILELARYAGARSVIMPTRPGVEFMPGPDNIRRFNEVLASRSLRMRDLVINTAHPQGGNLMAGDGSPHRSERVVDGSFRVVGFDNLYVADASVFPTSVTVNPQRTIMAMSSLAAARIHTAPEYAEMLMAGKGRRGAGVMRSR
jgi:choline dehydrogenase-like flavoprotein